MLLVKHFWLPDNRDCLFLIIVGYRTIENAYCKTFLATGQKKQIIKKKKQLATGQ